MNAYELESPEMKLVMWKCKEKFDSGLSKAQGNRIKITPAFSI